jgi:hypothetical protein
LEPLFQDLDILENPEEAGVAGRHEYRLEAAEGNTCGGDA